MAIASRAAAGGEGGDENFWLPEQRCSIQIIRPGSLVSEQIRMASASEHSIILIAVWRRASITSRSRSGLDRRVFRRRVTCPSPRFRLPRIFRAGFPESQRARYIHPLQVIGRTRTFGRDRGERINRRICSGWRQSAEIRKRFGGAGRSTRELPGTRSNPFRFPISSPWSRGCFTDGAEPPAGPMMDRHARAGAEGGGAPRARGIK
jgi:hypothetical protein